MLAELRRASSQDGADNQSLIERLIAGSLWLAWGLFCDMSGKDSIAAYLELLLAVLAVLASLVSYGGERPSHCQRRHQDGRKRNTIHISRYEDS
jgi:hypothetical protein